jgi:hypothetical protein
MPFASVDFVFEEGVSAIVAFLIPARLMESMIVPVRTPLDDPFEGDVELLQATTPTIIAQRVSPTKRWIAPTGKRRESMPDIKIRKLTVGITPQGSSALLSQRRQPQFKNRKAKIWNPILKRNLF